MYNIRGCFIPCRVKYWGLLVSTSLGIIPQAFSLRSGDNADPFITDGQWSMIYETVVFEKWQLTSIAEKYAFFLLLVIGRFGSDLCSNISW